MTLKSRNDEYIVAHLTASDLWDWDFWFQVFYTLSEGSSDVAFKEVLEELRSNRWRVEQEDT